MHTKALWSIWMWFFEHKQNKQNKQTNMSTNIPTKDNIIKKIYETLLLFLLFTLLAQKNYAHQQKHINK